MGGFLTRLRLVREIRSKPGFLHFRRWSLLNLPWFRLYLHQICQSDQDQHCHTHPWSFFSLILSGGYWETLELYGRQVCEYRGTGSLAYRPHWWPHQLTIERKGPVWTLVLALGPRKDWGYQTQSGLVPREQYRKLKNKGSLPC